MHRQKVMNVDTASTFLESLITFLLRHETRSTGVGPKCLWLAQSSRRPCARRLTEWRWVWGRTWQSKRAEWAIDNWQTKTTGVTVIGVIGFLCRRNLELKASFSAGQKTFLLFCCLWDLYTWKAHICAWNGGFMNVTWIPGATSHEEWTDASVSFNTLWPRDWKEEFSCKIMDHDKP